MHDLIDPDIRRASTLPSELYTDETWFARVREQVLARSWHYLGADDLPAGSVRPVVLLEGALDEPLVLTRGADGATSLLSNVCTHRGMIVASAQGPARQLRCGYHGRRWDLCGRFRAMPEFEGAEGFPRPADDLPQVPLARWHRLLFGSLDPAAPFHEIVAPMRERVGSLPLSSGVFDPDWARDYEIDASWIGYCDNYLEGFHVPWVHPSLARTLDYSRYRTELFPWGSVQIGVAADGEPAFDLPADHPDARQRIGGWYYWLFPTTMLNFYPWGISLNIVQPLGPQRTRVLYRAYVWDESKRDRGPGSGLHEVEAEDQAVVSTVQRGLRSRLYRRGRYSPAREQGVHHFHRLLAGSLRGP